MSALHFDADIDIQKLMTKVNQIDSNLTLLAKQAANSGSIVDNSFKQAGASADDFTKKTINVGNAMASIGALVSLSLLTGFAKEIANVRGEWQKYEAVLTNTLGSNQDAKDSLDMIAKYGAKTNFQVNELTDSFVKLASQGFKPTRDEMASLGDLAASKAKGFDQLTEAIIDAETFEFERLKEFGIRASKNGDQIQFTFKGIKTTVDASAESVRNYILSLGQLDGVKGSTDAISKTIVGLASNFEDAVNQMMNSLGKDQEGLIAGGIKAATELVNNYEKVVDILKVLIAGYGAYKVASIAVAVIDGYQAAAKLAAVKTISLMSTETVKLTFAQYAAAQAQGVLNAVTAINPYVAAATAIAAVVSALILFSDASNDAADAQKKINDTVNEQKAKVETLTTIIKSETSANADRAKAIKELNDLMPDNIGFLDAQTLSTKKGKEAIDSYIKSIRAKAEMEQLTADLKNNLDEQDRISSGNLNFGEAFVLSLKGERGGNEWQRGQAAMIYSLKEQEDAIKSKMAATMAGAKAGNEANEESLTIEERILKNKKELIAAESKLVELRKTGSKATPEDIEKQSDLVDRLKDQRETLTGIKEKAAKQEKEDVKSVVEASKEYLAIQQQILDKTKELNEANKAGNTEKGIQLTKDIDALQKQLSDLEKGKKITPIKAKLQGGIDPKQDLKPMKQLTEEQREQLKLREKRAEIDDEDKTQEILNLSRQFTSELISQLGLSEEQSKQMSGMVDTMFNLATGNFPAAAASAASMLLSAFTGNKKTDTAALALERMNNLLKQQSVILASLPGGSNYFNLAKKQYEDLGKQVDAYTKKLQNSKITNSVGISDYYKDYNTDDFIKRYTNGVLKLNDSQTEWITAIVEARKQQAELLQETFREALGFDASGVSDSIFQGIEDGLKLSENSLGGFAESFGQLMKTALMQSVIDSMQLGVTQKFLPKYQEFMKDGILTPTERKDLESLYAGLVKQGEIDTANIKAITDPYLGSSGSSSQNSMSSAIAGASEETVSLVAGQMMAIRVDIKANQQIAMNQLNLLDQCLSVQNKIELNTRGISRLENVVSELREVNSNLKKGLSI